MNNVLYINSCIRKESRTEKLAHMYIENLLKTGLYNVKEIKLKDLNLKPFNEEMLKERNEDVKKSNYDSDKYTYAKEFADADTIIISAPYWDCSFPSILKVYIEHICVNGITFEYTKEGIPIKKCKSDNLIYISTSGGNVPEDNSVKKYINEFGDMMGINNIKFYFAEGLDIYTNDVDNIINSTFKKMI